MQVAIADAGGPPSTDQQLLGLRHPGGQFVSE